ncbi:MAG TPA: proline dehydrogenase family protein [Myxococcales bacterium LLY-WYZ-16_1]|nr:proline dehydrogenase family protein [Myxococcales bacterium LLY-WYZ-16_1]
MWSRLVPGPLVRFFARPYVAGHSIGDAFDCAASAWSLARLRSTLDLLGEDVTEPDQVKANLRTYRQVIDRAAEDGRFEPGVRPTVSVKPSAFTTGQLDDSVEPVRSLAEHAHRRGVGLTVDMEDRRWTDLTLELATDLYRRGFDVGTVLQTRLNRTEKDLEAIPAGMRIRLVIGIYPEPAEVATTDKGVMKDRMLESAATLLERGARVEFATHDDGVLERFARELAPRAPDRCEVQMLLGVPRADMQHRLQEGYFGVPVPVRLYVPFAIGWRDATAYLRRRMAESPSMMWLVLRNLASRRRRRRALPIPSAPALEGPDGTSR